MEAAMSVTLTFFVTPIVTGIRMLVGLLQMAAASPAVPPSEPTTPPAIERPAAPLMNDGVEQSAEPIADGDSAR
jgi:hypothetical protein